MNLSIHIISALLRLPTVLKLSAALVNAAQILGWITVARGDDSIESSAPRPAPGSPLPAKASDAEPHPPKADAPDLAAKECAQETTILLVDDDPGVLKSLARVLRAQGWQVITAKDGAEALIQLNDQQPDLLVTDLSMGDISGWDLLFHEDMQRPNLPIFVITALPPPAIAGANYLAAEFFQKPFDPELLVTAIRRRLATPHRPIEKR